MTGMEAFRQAMRLLGYTDTVGEADGAQNTELYKRALSVVNQLTGELAYAENGERAAVLLSLRERLPLSETAARDCLPYGIAMLMAGSRGDGDNQQLFAALYDQKRIALGRRRERITDTLPRGDGV